MSGKQSHHQLTSQQDMQFGDRTACLVIELSGNRRGNALNFHERFRMDVGKFYFMGSIVKTWHQDTAVQGSDGTPIPGGI